VWHDFSVPQSLVSTENRASSTQAVLYFDSIAPRSEFKLPFRLRAKYPIRARTFESRVYEYYSPDVYSIAQPVQIEVRR
jgi:hypothetical protein